MQLGYLCSRLCNHVHVLRPLTETIPLGSRFYALVPRTGVVEFLDLDEHDVPAGRSWAASELRLKSFEDLHKLWYVCYKEQNMLLSEKARMALHGKRVPQWNRMKAVKQTMARIKHVLSDRAKDAKVLGASQRSALRDRINAK